MQHREHAWGAHENDLVGAYDDCANPPCICSSCLALGGARRQALKEDMLKESARFRKKMNQDTYGPCGEWDPEYNGRVDLSNGIVSRRGGAY